MAMFKVRTSVHIDRSTIDAIEVAALTALGQTMEAVHTEVVQAQVVPRRTGNLQNTHMVDYSQLPSGRVSLVATASYAQRCYFHPEIHFRTTENPNAKAYWFRAWLPGGAQERFSVDTYRQLLSRELAKI